MVVKGIPFLICNTCSRPLLVRHQMREKAVEAWTNIENVVGVEFVDPYCGWFPYRWHTHKNIDVQWKPDYTAVRGQCKGCRSQFFVRFSAQAAQELQVNLGPVQPSMDLRLKQMLDNMRTHAEVDAGKVWEPEHNWIQIECSAERQASLPEGWDTASYATFQNCHLAKWDEGGCDIGPQPL